MIGNSNIRMDKLEDLDTITFADFLSRLGLQNHVGFTIHQFQHTIDLVITRETSSCIAEVRKGFISLDNAFINDVLMVEKCYKTKTKVSFRKIKPFTPEEFKHDLAKFSKTFISLDEPLAIWSMSKKSTLTDIPNKHTQLETKVVKITHRQPWFNDHKGCEIILRCKKDHDWNNDPTAYSWNAFYQQRHFVSKFMDLAKWNYYLDCIKEHCFDTKPIFSMQNKMLKKSSNTPLPDHEDLTDLVNGFNNFFVDKVSNMRHLVPMGSNPTSQKYIEDQCTTDMRYSSFKQVIIETITNIIRNAPSESCKLDPLPISLVKEFTTEPSPTLTKLVNRSISIREFSDN